MSGGYVMAPGVGTDTTAADWAEFCRAHFCDSTPGVSP